MQFKHKKIVVAGAAGFIPGHLCEFFLQQGAQVIGLDNFITGSRENILLLQKYPQFSFHEWNVYLPLPWFLGPDYLKVDYVLSLASPASPIDFPAIPIEIMRVNSEGTRNLLELARVHGATFLEASTSEVYGDPEIHPQTETYWGNVNCTGPRACYDESKRFAEALTLSYHHQYQLPVRIVRIFNTYGPRMRPDDGRVIPNFINQALYNRPLTVYGNGMQTRSFCFVDDLVKGVVDVLTSKISTPVNVGNSEEIPIIEVAKLVIALVNSRSVIDFKILPENDPKRRRPDLTKLKNINGFVPQFDLTAGLKRTIAYFSELKIND